MKYFTKRSAAGKQLIRISVCLVLFLSGHCSIHAECPRRTICRVS